MVPINSQRLLEYWTKNIRCPTRSHRYLYRDVYCGSYKTVRKGK